VTLVFEHRGWQDLTRDDLYDVLRLRVDVYVGEQGITSEPEIDGLDPAAVHVLGRGSDGALVATARVRPVEGAWKVERVTVRRADRRRGVGTALLESVHALLGGRPAVMSAQDRQRAWYAARGWTAVGDVYDEAGIPHVRMVRPPPSGVAR
jgi:predicted GNAT family N-acyltransferase